MFLIFQAKEKGAPATMSEIWEIMHKKSYGTWVDRRVQKLHDDVTARVEEITSQPTPDGQPIELTLVAVNRIVYEATL